jgi:hypothetical protein
MEYDMNIRSLKSAIAAVAMGAAAFAPIAASAQSHHHHHHHGGGHYHHGGHYPGNWHGGGHYWSGGRYYYGPRYGYYDDDDSGAWVAGTIFGLAAGAIAAGAANSGRSVAYCEQRFRSYDPASGTYLGYDGYRHPCP